MRYLVKMKFGSEVYGTKLENSDVDIKAIHIPNMEDFILRKPKVNFDVQNSVTELEDFESYSLQYYLNLLCQGQTVVLDMLFTPKEFWIEYSPEWEYIVKNKEKFISKKIHPFVGYCRSQAAKYSTKGNRIKEAKIALDLITQHYQVIPSEKMQILFEDFVDLSKKHEHIKIIKKENIFGVIEEYISVCEKQIPKGANIKFGYNLISNLVNNYGKRTQETEKNEYDTKALYHAFRVAYEAIELLNTGKITFPRPEKEFLLAVRNKELKYSDLQIKLENLLEEVENCFVKSNLPDNPDNDFADCLIYWTYKSEIMKQ